MGYAKSAAALKRLQPLLDQMLKSDVSLSWPSQNAHMLGYHIREAMKIAESDPQSPYKGLRERFVIRNKGTHVVAEPRVINVVAELHQAHAKMSLENLSGLLELIGAVITHEAHEMFFPDALLTEEETKTLYEWAKPRGYSLVVGNGITITKENPGEAEWTP